MTAAPLQLSRGNTIIAVLLVLFGLQQVRWVVAQGYGDWSAFWAAGATAGTPDLLDPHKHAAWQNAHHVLTTIFPYLPGAAWLFAPSKGLSLPTGYLLNFGVMIVAAIAAATFASRIYRTPIAVSMLLILAWAPSMASLCTGQNSLLGLMFCATAIFGLAGNAPIVAGLAVGMLLYKLPYAIPFIVLLVVRRNVRALGVVIACACVWYLVSVSATAGDWHWPAHYASALQGYFNADFHANATKAVSVSGLLLRAGVPGPVALTFGALLLLVAAPLLARAPVLEAASFAPLLALAAGPHTLPYDAVLAIPALFYVFTHMTEPLRTRLMAASYVVAPVWIFTGFLHFDVLAVLCDGLALAWIVKGYNESTARGYFGIAHSGDRRQA